jgi:hypothetical protein
VEPGLGAVFAAEETFEFGEHAMANDE